VSQVTPNGEAPDPAWDGIVKVALEAYAARKGGGPAVAAQVGDSIRWSMQGRSVEDAIHRLAQLNEALLLIGSAAFDVAVRQINAPAKGLDAPIDYLDLLELIGEVVRNPGPLGGGATEG
jgi:hypothetical protein